VATVQRYVKLYQFIQLTAVTNATRQCRKECSFIRSCSQEKVTTNFLMHLGIVT